MSRGEPRPPEALPTPRGDPAATSAGTVTGWLEIVHPGLHTSVQDAGRPGWRRLGVPLGGALDGRLLRLANRLAWGPAGCDAERPTDTAPVLEALLLGPTLRAHGGALILGLAGDWHPRLQRGDRVRRLDSWRSLRLVPGDTLVLGPLHGRRAGCIAVPGLQIERLLGSASTETRAGFGGWQGRLLRPGDRLPVAVVDAPSPHPTRSGLHPRHPVPAALPAHASPAAAASSDAASAGASAAPSAAASASAAPAGLGLHRLPPRARRADLGAEADDGTAPEAAAGWPGGGGRPSARVAGGAYSSARMAGGAYPSAGEAGGAHPSAAAASGVLPPSGDACRVARVVLGPQQEHVDAPTLRRFLDGPWTLGREADRMGLRLEGPRLTHDPAWGAEIVSDASVPGSVQLPGHGQPIVLLVDGQTVGGYPKIATVISADLPVLGSAPLGSRWRFEAVDLAQAQQAVDDAARQLQALLAAICPVGEEGDAGFEPETAVAQERAVDLAALQHANLISGVVRGGWRPAAAPEADDARRRGLPDTPPPDADPWD